MATNDTLLLDGLVDDLLEKEGSSDRGRVFELFALQQILKEWDLSVDELASGWTDGRQDGGIDGFYVLVNGHCIREISDFLWPRVSADIVVHIITCKHADGFSQAPLDALVASLTELLDFSIDDGILKGSYSKSLLTCRTRLLLSYRKLAPRLASFRVNISYASRGNKSLGIGVEVRSRANQIQKLVREYFNDAEANFEFIGATELVELHRRRNKFSLDLPFAASLTSPGANYVLLVKLTDYFNFCRDEDGKLRRYLFDSNVRDFMGLNRVNEDIAKTLGDRGTPDFWWLNNGVTILATNAWSTSNTLHMENVQIVNGLQTTESIYRFFSSEANKALEGSTETLIPEQRAIMVKVICSVDEEARDLIVRATNNQTGVEQISLHATEKIHRDIEEALLRAGLHYERRKNFYANQGVAISSIITPMYLAAGVLALGRRREPWSAVALRQRHLRKGGLHDELFSERTSLKIWRPIASVLKAVDSVLEEARPRRASDGFLKNNRYILALLTVARRFGTFNYTDEALSDLYCDTSFVDLIRTTLSFLSLSQLGNCRSRVDACRVCEQVAKQYDIAHIERIRRANSSMQTQELHMRQQPTTNISEEFMDRVLTALPPQPWKPGVHLVVSAKLDCSVNDYFAAVERLINSGRVLRQKDGVLYAPDGSVRGYDPERVLIGPDGSFALIEQTDVLR